MKSKKPAPFRLKSPGRRGEASGYVAHDLGGAAEAADSGAEPQAEPEDRAEHEAETAPEPPADPEPLDLEALEMKSPDSIGAVTPADERLIQSQDESAALPLLKPLTTVADSIPVPSPAPLVTTAALMSVVGILAPIAFAWGYRREIMPFQNDVFALTLFLPMAVGLLGLIWGVAYMIHQGRRLSAETRRAQLLAENLMQPAALAARGAGTAVEQIRLEIKNAAAMAERARGELLNLREVLALESERLVEAAQGSSRSVAHISETLGGERARLEEISALLDARADKVTDAIGRQGRMVAEASDLAETQLREAEALLAARAADLAAAAGEASDASRLASEDLSRQVARLETAGLGVGDQARLVEETLTQQRAALIAAAHDMRADHEVLAAQSETQLAHLRDMIVHARAGAGEITDNALQSSDTLRHLMAQAADQLRQMGDAAAQERDLFSAGAAQSLGAVQEMAAREREALARQTRLSIDDLTTAADQAAANAARSLAALTEAAGREREAVEHGVREAIEALSQAADHAAASAARQAEAARDKVDQLGEAAFAAGQKADAIFEARLADARGLIEQSAEMMAQAGARANTRLEDGLAETRRALGHMEGVLGELEQRLARLPADAESQAQSVRASIERSMETLMASARRAAEETQSIDAAFQERVRRNYEMLSEAVRLMGVVAGSAGTTGAGRAPPPLTPPPVSAPPQRPATSSFARAPEPERAPPPRPERPLDRVSDWATDRAPERAPERPVERAPEPLPRPAAPLAAPEEAGLRPRLKLTPTTSDQEVKTVFSPPQAPAGGAGGRPGETIGDSWSWRELLSSMDNEGAAEDPALGDQLLTEIEAMGIDAVALLPRTRIEEVAAALNAGGDPEISREVVRRSAPAAVRRLARRLMSDRAFRGQADRFSRRYQELVGDAARDRDGMVAMALLASDQGRAFLLIDAAFSEMI